MFYDKLGHKALGCNSKSGSGLLLDWSKGFQNGMSLPNWTKTQNEDPSIFPKDAQTYIMHSQYVDR